MSLRVGAIGHAGTLTLTSSSGDLRLWRNKSKTATNVPAPPGLSFAPIDLPPNQPMEIEVFLEGARTNSHAKDVIEVEAKWLADTSAYNNGNNSSLVPPIPLADLQALDVRDDFLLSIYRVDLDTDSDNNAGAGWEGENYTAASRGLEDRIENTQDYPGLILTNGQADSDADGVVDHLDGFDHDGIVGNDDDELAGKQFQPISLRLLTPYDVANTVVKFTYQQADPASAGTSQNGLRLWLAQSDGGTRFADGPATGRDRNPASILAASPGDFVPSGAEIPWDTLYAQAKSKTSEPKIYLYLEAVGGLSGTHVVTAEQIEFDAAGNEIANCSDALKATTTLPLLVTDESTISDNLPYSACPIPIYSGNEKLALVARGHQESAEVRIDLPPEINREGLVWRIVEWGGSAIASGDFSNPSGESVELSLTINGSFSGDRRYVVEAGDAVGQPFAPRGIVEVAVVRNRLNWFFDPFSEHFEWRPSEPEPRVDVGDYPVNKATAYRLESLQSIYDFVTSTAPYGSIAKTSWTATGVSCFGEFLELLRERNSRSGLNDLSTVPLVETSPGIGLSSFSGKYAALRYTQAKQTTYGSDPNPTLRADQHAERVAWAGEAAQSLADSRISRARILALWAREGSMAVNSEDHQNNNNNYSAVKVWPLGFNAAVSAAPASADHAKIIYVYDVAYICLGSDFLLKKSGGPDNQPDLTDYSAATAHFTNAADGMLGAGTGDGVLGFLTVTQDAAGEYVVSAAGEFYEQMLGLVGAHYLSVWQQEGPAATYQAYNMGIGKFNQMKATLADANYPERGRLGLVDWSIHYEIRTGEWHQPRDFAQKFYCYMKAFEERYP